MRLFMKLPIFHVFSCSLFHLVELNVMGYFLGEEGVIPMQNVRKSVPQNPK